MYNTRELYNIILLCMVLTFLRFVSTPTSMCINVYYKGEVTIVLGKKNNNTSVNGQR